MKNLEHQIENRKSENRKLTRGVRNNNPLNIIVSKSKWAGKVTDPLQKKDKTFEEFDTMVNGIRAAIMLIQNYIRRGINTVPAIIQRWCPDQTAPSYTKYVVGRMKAFMPTFEKKDPIHRQDFKTLMRLVQAMSKLESLYEISDSEFEEAWNLISGPRPQ